jgi:hypothetical protein
MNAMARNMILDCMMINLHDVIENWFENRDGNIH